MLEARIEELTKAVRDLIDVMREPQKYKVSKGFSMLPADTIEQVAQAAKIMGDSVQITEVPNVNQKSSPTTSTSEPSSPESASATYDDVKKLVIAISKTSRDKAVAALQRLGVSKATELKEHQWPAAAAYLTKVAAGEVDPESAHE